MNDNLLPRNSGQANKSALDLLWQPSALLAILCIGELIAAILTLAQSNAVDRWIYFGLSSIAIQWIVFLTLGFIYLIHNSVLHLSLNATAWICLAIFVLNTFLLSLFIWNAIQLTPFQGNSIWQFSLSMTLIATLIGLMSLAAFQTHWKSRQYALKSKQSQLDALHARIKPHFLFNTLNSLAALIPKNPELAEKLLFNLVDLFRAAISDEAEVKLSAELETTRQYLEIEKIRFGERLEIKWDLPEKIPVVMLPSLSLQPLAENAVKHGVSQNPEGGIITIKVDLLSETVRVQVCNSFLAFSHPTDTSGFKIGLESTKERINLMSDGANTLKTYVRDQQFIAEIIISWKPAT